MTPVSVLVKSFRSAWMFCFQLLRIGTDVTDAASMSPVELALHRWASQRAVLFLLSPSFLFFIPEISKGKCRLSAKHEVCCRQVNQH